MSTEPWLKIAPPMPAPPPPPEYTETTGKLAACSGGWCVSGKALNFGATSAQAKSDFDGDGTVETKGDELAGLAGSTVQGKYKTVGALVVALQGKAY